jgi:pimeloyl-ACP methyl ester carboxylesterase
MKTRILLAIPSIVVLVVAVGAGALHAGQGETVSADGVPIRYRVEGSGEPPLVFVHCWCCDGGYWKDQVRHFSKRYTVVTVDLAGHGESGMGRETWTVQAFGEDVAAVVEALGLERVILIGHSMGGPVNLEAARRMPGRVLGIIGVDTYQRLGQKAPEEMAQNFVKPFEADFRAMTTDFVKKMFPPGADSSLVARVATDMASAPQAVGIAALKANLAYDPTAALAELRVPIYGINGSLFPVDIETGKRYAEIFEVRIMQGLGHFPMLEDPEGFNENLEAIVESLVR